jgi:hypothetical protein
VDAFVFLDKCEERALNERALAVWAIDVDSLLAAAVVTVSCLEAGPVWCRRPVGLGLDTALIAIVVAVGSTVEGLPPATPESAVQTPA